MAGTVQGWACIKQYNLLEFSGSCYFITQSLEILSSFFPSLSLEYFLDTLIPDKSFRFWGEKKVILRRHK